jgi:c-di-GMP-binding flagellar brake protein YcgR
MSGFERRAYERVPFLCAATIAAHPGGKPLDARTLDISLGGVGLTCSGRFLPGTLVAIVFRLKNARREPCEERIIGKVMRFTADLDGNQIGIEFLSPISAADNPALTRAVNQL